MEEREARKKGDKKKGKNKQKKQKKKKIGQRTDSTSITEVLTELVACMKDPTSSACTDAFG